MRIDKLCDKIRDNGLQLPTFGTGKNGRILARDLEATLGDYFASIKYRTAAEQEHLALRRKYPPMKAFRYKELSPIEKLDLWEDNNEWVLEKKFDGWRIMVTSIPGAGYMVWGGNISDVDFLPVDYTEHILFDNWRPTRIPDSYINNLKCIIDCECICEDSVLTLEGQTTSGTLEAMKAILGSDPERALELQQRATIDFYAFDCVFSREVLSLAQRSYDLHEICRSLGFHRVEQITINKKLALTEIWENGGEGAILKNVAGKYIPGSRDRLLNVKVKRSVSGEIGRDIDAFIIGYIKTPEWGKKDLIGGIKLGVKIEDGTTHHIATVTSMPDNIRMLLTLRTYDHDFRVKQVYLHTEYYDKVLVIDGQELSSRNKRIMHAKVDWRRGFRQTKSASECTLNLKALTGDKF